MSAETQEIYPTFHSAFFKIGPPDDPASRLKYYQDRFLTAQQELLAEEKEQGVSMEDEMIVIIGSTAYKCSKSLGASVECLLERRDTDREQYLDLRKQFDTFRQQFCQMEDIRARLIAQANPQDE